MRGRIQVDMSDHYKELAFPQLVESYEAMFQEMMVVNKAHAVMLYDQEILDLETVKKILTALDEIQNTFTVEDLSTDKEDLYFNVEGVLIDKIGGTFGGRLHTGRSRNDLYSTLARMTIRKSLWPVMGKVIELEELLISLARKHLDTVITGYTHCQPAQPTTLAHYLTSCLNVLGRDFQRLVEAYQVTNLSPLGAAAFAGTGFPLNRQQTAGLLGFDGVLDNTWDCVASRDYLLQAESAMAIMMSTLSRVAQDLYFWCTDEVAILEIGGEVAAQSSIMPQKKNPSILEYVRGKSGQPLAAFISSYTAFKGTPFSFCCDMMELNTFYDKARTETLVAIEMLEETFKYSRINKERALKMARQNFCTVTGLADYLVQKFNISFRDAHHITGGMVADAKGAGEDVSWMDTALLNRWSQQILGRDLELTEEELQEALAPAGNVQSKQNLGGPSTQAVSAMILLAEDRVESQQEWLEQAMTQVSDSYELTDREMNRILSL